MRAQRVREGESRVEMQAAKWTAEGAVNSHYFESAVQTVKQGGTAGSLSYARP